MKCKPGDLVRWKIESSKHIGEIAIIVTTYERSYGLSFKFFDFDNKCYRLTGTFDDDDEFDTIWEIL